VAKRKTGTFFDRVRRAGCWAVGLYAFAVFFTIGALVSLLNVDIIRAIEGGALAALCLGVGIWLARKGAGR
jgi:hypothetical protein